MCLRRRILSWVLPNAAIIRFASVESAFLTNKMHWEMSCQACLPKAIGSPSLGVTDPHSTENQVALAIDLLQSLPPLQRVFLFINISALHQPNCIFRPGATVDSRETQAAALAYVDRHLPPLFQAMQQRAPTNCIICSDHGTAYGEDDYIGHRLSHPVVWTVPYAEFVLESIREF